MKGVIEFLIEGASKTVWILVWTLLKVRKAVLLFHVKRADKDFT